MGNPFLLTPAVLVLCVAVIAWLDAPRAANKRLDKLARRTGLALDEATRRLVGDRLRRRQRGMMAGMAVGALGSCFPLLILTSSSSAYAWWIAVYMTSAGIGALVVHVVDAGRAASEPGPRAAVLRPRRLQDFLYPAELAAPFAALVFPTLALTLAVSSTGSGAPVSQGYWLAAGALVAVLVTVATAFAQRFVLHMAPPADAPNRLKWEDALRGTALRDLGLTAYCTSFALGALAAYAGATDSAAGYPVPVLTVTLLAVLVAFAGLVALTVVAEGVTSPARRFLRLYGDAPTETRR